jgi:hypothetical protein
MEPPKKDSEPTPENVAQLEQWLTSIIAGHPGATRSYTFYEEIDKYLGPWGKEGYPIGYGKKYNLLFTTEPHLMTNGDVQQWVRKTTIKLQEALRDFIVEAYRNERLYPSSQEYWKPDLLKSNLTKAAFKSHAQAYVSGGLTVVALLSPNSLWDIGNIPRKEFSPLSPNFKVSVEQVFSVIDKVIPETAGITLSTAAGPAHSRSLQYAHHKDLEAVRGQAQAINSLNWLRAAIERRELDVPPTLDDIIRRLNAKEYPDMRTAALARKVIESARQRKAALTYGYRMELLDDPSLRPFYDKYLQGWDRP